MSTKREGDTSSGTPSARFLQAALDNDHSTYNAPPSSTTDEKPPPVLAETAVKHLQLDVESAALIRAAEEFMMLTRTLKEIWLFGQLDTITDTSSQDVEQRQQMETDEKFVVQGFLDMLAKMDGGNELATNGTHKDHDSDG